MLEIVKLACGAVLIGLLLGICARAAEAQGWDVRLPDAGYIGLGVSTVMTEELDDHLESRGYPTFGQEAANPGIGAYWARRSGWMFGGEWNGFVLSEEPYQGREVGLGGGYATIGIGYLSSLSRQVRVYPRLGLGGGGMGLWIEDEEAPVEFDEVLADPEGAEEDVRETVLSRVSMVLDIGAGVELLPRGRRRGPMLGLRFGYLAAPFSSNWQLDDRTVEGGPDASIAGPYVRVVLGAAWGGR